MKHLADILTSLAATAIWTTLAAAAGLVFRRQRHADRPAEQGTQVESNTATVVGDGNSVVQVGKREIHTHVTVHPPPNATAADETDALIMFAAAMILFLVSALIAFSYANRFVPAAVGVISLFVALAARSAVTSLANGLLSMVAFAGYLLWPRIGFGEAAVQDVAGFAHSPSQVLSGWFALNSDQRYMYGTALVVLVVALLWTLVMAAEVVRERSATMPSTRGAEWFGGGITIVVAVALGLTWLGVLPQQIQLWLA